MVEGDGGVEGDEGDEGEGVQGGQPLQDCAAQVLQGRLKRDTIRFDVDQGNLNGGSTEKGLPGVEGLRWAGGPD